MMMILMMMTISTAVRKFGNAVKMGRLRSFVSFFRACGAQARVHYVVSWKVYLIIRPFALMRMISSRVQEHRRKGVS